MSARDHRLGEAPFLDAPYIHQHNEPKFHALLMRATEHAKRCADGPKYTLWIVAQDTPVNPDEIGPDASQVEKKRAKWLQFHDQKTNGIPGILPMYENMRARVSSLVVASSAQRFPGDFKVHGTQEGWQG